MSTTLISIRSARSSTRQGWLGVDIGCSAVKVAQVQRRGSEWELVFSKLFTIRQGSDGLATAEMAIQNVLGNHHRWFRQPAACVMTKSCELRSIDLPARAWQERRNEVSQQLGVQSKDATVMVWTSSWERTESDNIPCHVISMREQTAVKIGQRLLSSRAECQLLDGLPFCLARQAMLASPSSQEVTAVVDWAAENPMFVLVRDGQPYFTRLLRKCSFNNLVKSVCDHLNLEPTDVWSLLSEINLKARQGQDLPELSKTIIDLTQTVRQRFINEINRTLAFLRSESSELLPSRLWLSGGGASFPNLANEVSNSINIATQVWGFAGSHKMNIDPVFANAISLSANPIL